MTVPDTLCSLAISITLSAVLCSLLWLAIPVRALAASSAPDPIQRGSATHNGLGDPWTPSYPAYDGWPYGR